MKVLGTKHNERSAFCFQKCAATHTSPLLLLPFTENQMNSKRLSVTYNALRGWAPAAELLRPFNSSWPLRSHDQGFLPVPYTYVKSRGDQAFKVVGMPFISQSGEVIIIVSFPLIIVPLFLAIIHI